jgi:hypothetical protein
MQLSFPDVIINLAIQKFVILIIYQKQWKPLSLEAAWKLLKHTFTTKHDPNQFHIRNANQNPHLLDFNWFAMLTMKFTRLQPCHCNPSPVLTVSLYHKFEITSMKFWLNVTFEKYFYWECSCIPLKQSIHPKTNHLYLQSPCNSTSTTVTHSYKQVVSAEWQISSKSSKNT